MRNQRTRHSLAADRSGFISMYAVVILQVVLLFSAMICLRSKSIVMSRQADDLIDVYVINHVKAIFETNYPKSEQLVWKDYDIDITYQDLIADVRCTNQKGISFTMQIEYDDICMCVMKTAYS